MSNEIRFGLSGRVVVVTGGAQGPEGSLICLIFFAGAIATLLWRLRKSANRPQNDAGCLCRPV